MKQIFRGRFVLNFAALALAGGCAKSNLSFNDDISASSSGTQSLCVDSSSHGSPTPLRRLSKRELSNSIRDIFGAAITSGVSDELAIIPNDERGAKFDHVGNTTNYGHAESFFFFAESLGEEIIVRNPSFMGVGTCLAGADDVVCMNQFVSSLGYLLFRRPLTSEELTTYNFLYTSVRAESKFEAAKMVVASLVQSPNFYYIPEIAGKTIKNDTFELSNFELVTRISFAMTGSTPDSVLLSTAANGTIKDPKVLEAQIERLLSSSKGRSHIKEYATQLLHLDTIPAFGYSNTFLSGQSIAGLSAQMVQEAQDYMLYHLLDNTRTYSDLMTSRISFIPNPELADVYGVKPSKLNKGEVTLPPEREGLLTRAALLASGNDQHGPFHRGQIIATDILCNVVGRPSADAVPEAFETIGDIESMTTRAHLEQMTNKTNCAGCHSTLNSFGFALENFDSLGRFRTFENKTNAAGEITGTFAIDAQTAPRIDGIQVGVNGAADLSRRLATSKQAQACFSRKWLRFATAKTENLRADGCGIEKMVTAMNDKQSGLAGMLTKIFVTKEFNHRVMPEK